MASQVEERKFFVGGNWKMNGSKKSIDDLLLNLTKLRLPDKTDIVVSPPSIYLDYVIKQLERSTIQVSAQNCYKEAKGPYTGEISAEMIRDIGANWVIIGHSERRNVFGENDILISEKVSHALSANLNVILCIGENLEERKEDETMKIIFKQLLPCLDKITDWKKVVLAYEPVWAIGTGETATPNQAQEVHGSIRQWLNDKVSPDVAGAIRIIYGGSVNGENCIELAAQSDIDGFLVGGASLLPEFNEIIRSKR